MRAVLQRVKRAAVRTGENLCGQIGPGLLVLLGIARDDTEMTCRRLASQTARLRIFDDETGKMNRSLLDTGGEALVVSQFTLLADTSGGLRPSFSRACEPARARELYEQYVAELNYIGVSTRTGVFGAKMEVELVNDGPVTIVLDSTAAPTERAP